MELHAPGASPVIKSLPSVSGDDAQIHHSGRAIHDRAHQDPGCQTCTASQMLPFRYFSQMHAGWWFQPLWKILVNWDDYSQYMGKWKMFQTTNQHVASDAVDNCWHLLYWLFFLLLHVQAICGMFRPFTVCSSKSPRGSLTSESFETESIRIPTLISSSAARVTTLPRFQLAASDTSRSSQSTTIKVCMTCPKQSVLLSFPVHLIIRFSNLKGRPRKTKIN